MSTISQKLFICATAALLYSKANSSEHLECCLGCLAVSIAVACIFNNWVWRFIVFAVSAFMTPQVSIILTLAQFLAIYNVPTFALFGVRKPQSIQGAVFITGCDSGMGFWTASHLADEGFEVIASCFMDDSEEKLKEHSNSPDRIHCVKLDVSSDASVASAEEWTRKKLNELNTGLVGVINCAGLGYNGPAEYFPMEMYKRQMDVNFFGYVRVVQAFMPLLKTGVTDTSGIHRRGRIVFIGTGGGVLSPAPPLLSAYMASKWAIEAFCGCMRLEMQLKSIPIDLCVLNPGFVKPTMLMEQGLELTRRMWDSCKKITKDDRAQDEYGDLLNQFIQFSANEPGTHVSEVAKTMKDIMVAHRPNATYKVGPDSQAAPFVGLLPTAIREFIVKYSMYKQVGRS